MGLLSSQGNPLTWNEIKLLTEHVRQHGIKQFINIYKKNKDRLDIDFKWGDEIEYIIVKFDQQQQKARVCLKADQLLNITDQWEQEQGSKRNCLWRPEAIAFMIEGTPGHPYVDGKNNSIFSSFLNVEQNMRSRRKELEHLLEMDEELLTITSFPMLGTSDFCFPPQKINPQNSLLGSIFFPDDCIFNGHSRFKSMAINMRSRRQRKVIINVPVFLDVNTLAPFIEQFEYYHLESNEAVEPDHVYMDSVGFGMGCCCLQVTFQAKTLNEACLLYDQIAPMSPLMMALSAACPIQRGFLTNQDHRWSVISQAGDERTKEELGEIPLQKCECKDSAKKNEQFEVFDMEKLAKHQSYNQVSHNPVRTCANCNGTHYRVNKSRFDSIDLYISKEGEAYNDIPVTYNVDYYNEMVDAGVEPPIALHISHLFIRDPINVYREKLHQNDDIECDHFENIQSTNWQTMRFKPPPPNSNIGWRIEFRPMDVQLTDFENAAYATFIILLTRVILENQLNLLIPISKMDENIREAQKRDAVNQCKFWFHKEINSKKSVKESSTIDSIIKESYVMMSLNEIFNGKGDDFDGLIPMIRNYLANKSIDLETNHCLQQYLNLIADRASGKCWTAAKWIRNFVLSHPNYKKDSVISSKINFDLIQSMCCISRDNQKSLKIFYENIQAINNHKQRTKHESLNWRSSKTFCDKSNLIKI